MKTLKKTEYRTYGVVIVVSLLLCAALSPIFTDDSNAEDTDVHNSATIDIQPGQTWSWTPKFTEGLSPTVTVAGSESEMPADTAAFAVTSGYASVADGKVTVTIPTDYTISEYYVKVHAETSQPTQHAYYGLTFNVATFEMYYSDRQVVAEYGTFITIEPTLINATATSYTISPSILPAGLSFNTDTGVIYGIPTEYWGETDYTVSAFLNTTPVQVVTADVSISVIGKSYTIYAVVNNTQINAPGITVPSFAVDDGDIFNFVEKDGSDYGRIYVNEDFFGMCIGEDGEISGMPNDVGTYVFNQQRVAKDGDSWEVQRTVTVIVEQPVSLESVIAYSYEHHPDTSANLRSGGLEVDNTHYEILRIDKDGEQFSNPDSDGFDLVITSDEVKVICGISDLITAGTYDVYVLAATKNDTSTFEDGFASNAYALNNVDATVIFIVSPEITCSSEDVYTTVSNSVCEISSNLASNVAGAIFTAEYGTGITESNVTVGSDGTIAVNYEEPIGIAGDYVIFVTATDPNNPDNIATGTVTVHVVGNLVFTDEPSAGIIGE